MNHFDDRKSHEIFYKHQIANELFQIYHQAFSS